MKTTLTKRFVWVATVFVVVTSLGCATGYSSKGLTGSFSETRLNARSYQVRFEGNGLASQERVSAFLLRRCAEPTRTSKSFLLMRSTSLAARATTSSLMDAGAPCETT